MTGAFIGGDFKNMFPAASCLLCKEPGHSASKCPELRQPEKVSGGGGGGGGDDDGEEAPQN